MNIKVLAQGASNLLIKRYTGPFEYYPGRLKKTLVLRGEQMYRYLKRFMMR